MAQSILGDGEKNEPLFDITKRTNVSFKHAIIVRAITIVTSVVFMSLLMMVLAKENPLTLLKSIFSGAFGTPLRTWILCAHSRI